MGTIKKSTVTFIIICYIFITHFAFAYFGDLTIDINNKGEVIISGQTDCPELENIKDSLKFTQIKNNKILVNISPECFFEAINYNIRLPSDALLNYFKSSTRFIITTEKDRIVIKGSDSSKNLELVLQFSAIKTQKTNYLLIFFITLTVVLSLVLTLILAKQRKNKFNFDELNDRQKIIIEILLKEKTVTQSELTKRLGLPKSSVSRNVSSLLRRGIIIKEKTAKTNVLKLNEEYFQKKKEIN